MPPVGSRQPALAPGTRGEMVWDGCRARAVAGCAAWIEQVCDEAGASLVERGRVKEHCLRVLHKWDYDLDSVKQNWKVTMRKSCPVPSHFAVLKRICSLVPVPATGAAHWSRNDSFLLEEIMANFPQESKWKRTARNALSNHTEGEIMERMLWLQGERTTNRPFLSYVPQPFKPQSDVRIDRPARVVVVASRPHAPPPQQQQQQQQQVQVQQPSQTQHRQEEQQRLPPPPPPPQPQPAQQPPFHPSPSANDSSASASEPKKRKIHSELRRIQEHIQEHNQSLSNSPAPAPKSTL